MPSRLSIGRACWAVALVLVVFPLTGSAQSLVVESDPMGARVEVDGVFAGTTPLVRSVSPGRRAVLVRRAGFAPWQQDVDVTASDTTRVMATLDPLLGTLELEGLPDGATATVDGQAIEGSAAVGVGPSIVVVHVPGRPDARQRVSVAEGRTTSVSYEPRQFSGVWAAAALAVPGGVQVAERRPLIGVAVLAGVAGSAGLALLADARMSAAREDYQQAVYDYNAATSETDVAQARARIDDQIDRSHRFQTTRRIALGAMATVYLAGATDALLHHVLRPGLRASAPKLPPVSIHAQDGGLSLTVRL